MSDPQTPAPAQTTQEPKQQEPQTPQQKQAPREPPRRYQLPTGEEMDEDELLAVAAERRIDNRSVEARLKRLQELEELEEKLHKDPYSALTPERRRELALREAKAWQEEEEERNLPPEQRRWLQMQRELKEREEKLQRAEKEREQREQQAQMETFREQAVADVKQALELSGLPKTPATAKRLLEVMAAAARKGVAYPPQVLARKLRSSWEGDTGEALKTMGPARALRALPGLVEALNALDDADALKLLAPLGERLRRLNLEARGLAPAQVPGGDQQSRRPAASDTKRAPEDPWEAQERIRRRAQGR